VSASSDPVTDPEPDGQPVEEPVHEPVLAFDRHLVIEQLGGWRGMVDATVPTVGFILANAFWGLRIGIWAALGAALVVFVLRLVRHESVQQALSGLLGVGIAVAIAAASGQARDFFVFGILRNAAIGVLLLGSVPVRWPLVGVIAEFLAPSHLGSLATHSLPGMRNRFPRPAAADGGVHEATDGRVPDPEPERHWRDDPRLLRAYTWLTVLWGGTFAVRAIVAWLLYLQSQHDVTALGTVSLALGLPVTAVEILLTLWVISRLHRHRCPRPAPEPGA
jgi:hypothetical protein